MLLRQRVWKYCLSHRLLAPGATVVLGVSGGPDSLCLLDLLHGLAAAQSLSLTIAHLDHGLRAAAAAEADFVRAEAAVRQIPCYVERVDAGAYAAAQGLSVEAAGRRLRYAFLVRVARQVSAEQIAVAHTADDQAETVLMHFLRGSGLAGLRGMEPKTDISDLETGIPAGDEPITDHELPITSDRSPLTLIRPLLAESRSSILAYCQEHNLQPRHDETNQDMRYWRNHVRHVVLPSLEQHNPNLRRTLARMAEVLAGEHALLRAAVEGLMARTAPVEWLAPGQVAWDRAAWQGLTLPEQRALLRRGIEQLRGPVRDVDFAPLDAAARFAASAAPGRSCSVAAGLRLIVGADRLVLTAGPGTPPGLDGPMLDAQGRLAGGWRLEVDQLAAGAWRRADVMAPGAWEAYVDADRVTGPLAVRPRRPGERFQPLGLGGHSDKVSDHMINARLPAALRDRWPVVTCGDAIVWLPGLRLDERFKVSAATRAVLRLRFTRPAR